MKFSKALYDIMNGVKQFTLIFFLSRQDLQQQYKRTILGPFWITVSIALMITVIGFVFGRVFNNSHQEYLVSLGIGLIIWRFIKGLLSDGAMVFVSSSKIIKQLPVPLFSHLLKISFRHSIILGHNIILLPILFWIAKIPIKFEALFCIAGFLLLFMNLLWLGLLLAIFCTRYRDFNQFVNNVLQIGYYITPIIWLPNLMDSRVSQSILSMNPFYHLIEIVRQPLLGIGINPIHWYICAGFLILGWIITTVVFSNYRSKIVYWL